MRNALRILALILLAALPASSQVPRLPDFETVRVSQEELKQIGTESRENWLLPDWEKLVKEASEVANGLPEPQLTRCTYEAIAVDGALRQGTFRWEIPANSEWIRLGTPGLALSNVAWENRPAVFGTDREGTTWLHVDRPNDVLVGEWELRGRSIGEATLYQFRSPLAGTVRLVLKTPSQYTLTCPGAEVESLDLPESGWKSWRIEAGRRNVLSISIRPAQEDFSSSPIVIARQATICTARQDGARIQTEINFDVFRHPIREIKFEFDSSLEIYGVSLGEIPYPWRIEREGNEKPRLVVESVDPILGTGKTIRIRALSQLEVGKEWTVPSLKMEGALVVSGLLTVAPRFPLVLNSFVVTGYKQTVVSNDPENGESFTFRQYLPVADCRLVLNIPELRANATVFSDVKLAGNRWELRSEIAWQARLGQSFTVRSQIPEGWAVSQVRSMTETIGIANWDVVSDEQGQKQLIVEFQEAISPDRGASIEILADRTALSGTAEFPIPAIVPLDLDNLELGMRIEPPDRAQLVLSSGTSFESVRASDWPESWREGTFWKPLLAKTGEAIWLKNQDTRPQGKLLIETRRAPITALARMETEFLERQVLERFEIKLTPRQGNIDRVLIHVTEQGPPIEWQVEGVPFDANLLPVAQHAVWDLPPTGELWDLRFREPLSVEWTVTGKRSRPMSSQGRCSLVFVPQSDTYEGEIVIAAPRSLGIRLEPSREITGPGDLELEGDEQRWQWQFQQRRARIDWRGTQEGTPLISLIDRCLAELTLASRPGDRDVCTLDLSWGSSGPQDRLLFRLPEGANLDSVTIGDQLVVVTEGGDGRLSVTIPSGVDHVNARILYSLVPEWSPFRREARIRLPEFEQQVLRVDARIVTSNEWRLSRIQGLVPHKEKNSPIWKGIYGESFFEEASTGNVITAWAPTLPSEIVFSLTETSRYRWLMCSLFFFVLLATLTFRQFFPNRGKIVSRLLIAFLLWASLAFEYPENKVATVSLAGFVLALILPRAWFGRIRWPAIKQIPIPTGSTETMLPKGVFLLLLALSLFFVSWNRNFSNAQENAKPIVFLLPNSNPEKPAVVFVPKTLSEELQRIRNTRPNPPEYLIHSLRYQGDFSPDSGWSMRANFVVQCLKQSPSIRIRIPIGPLLLGGEDACLLNGIPHPLLLVEETGLELEIPGYQPVLDGPPDQPGCQPHQIELQCYLPKDPLLVLPEFQIRVPVVAQSDLELRSPQSLKNFHVVEGIGKTEFDETGSELRAQIGAVSQVTLDSGDKLLDPSLSARVDLVSTCLVDVEPASLHLRYKLSCKIMSGSIESLRFRIPGDALLANISGADILSQSVMTELEGTQTVTIVFREPKSTDFQVICDCYQSHQTRLRIPAATFPSDFVRDNRLLIGIQIPAELGFSLTGDLGEKAREIDPQLFRDQWQEPVERLQAVVRIFDLVDLQWHLQPLLPTRNYQTNLVAHVKPSAIHWTMTAIVEIKGASTFGHLLRVPDSLEITDIQVQQDSAQRLLRWSRQGDQVSLFLANASSGTQTISISGSIPITIPGTAELPQIELQEGKLLNHRIQIWEDPSLMVAWRNPEQIALGKKLNIPRTPQSPGLLFDALEFSEKALSPEGRGPLELRVSPSTPEIECESLHILTPREGRWRLASRFLFQSRRGHVPSATISIPPELTGIEIDSGELRSSQERYEDGSTRITLQPKDLTKDQLVLGVVGMIPRPAQGDWTLPLIKPVNVSQEEAFLVLGDKQPLKPVGLEASSLPIRLAAIAPPGGIPDQAKYYQIKAPVLLKDSSQPTLDRPVSPGIIHWTESFVWLNSPGAAQGESIFGRTVWFFRSPDQNRILVELPEGARPLLALVSGLPVPIEPVIPPKGNGHQYLLEWTASSSGQVLTLDWTLPWSSSPMILERSSIPLPVFGSSDNGNQLIALIPGPGSLIWGNRLNPRTQLERVRQIRKWVEGELTDPRVREEIHQSLNQTLAELKQLSPEPDLELDAEIEAQKRPAATGSSSRFILDIPLNAAGRVDYAQADRKIWIISKWSLRYLLSTFFVLSLAAITLFLSRFQFLRSLSIHPILHWSLLGLLLLLCQIPPWLAWFLAFAGMFAHLLSRPHSTEAEFVLNSGV